MADATYIPKIYNADGGDELVVANGGEIKIETGGSISANGTQAAHVADASTAHALNSTFSDTEAEAALNALGTKINAILAVLEGVGATATS